MNEKLPPIELISDLAIAELDNSRKDALEFSSYADVIARIVAGTRGPFTVGIFGKWGMGKTSLMRLVEQEVRNDGGRDQKIIPVWFNAWMFERSEYPVVPLLKSIVEALKIERSTLNAFGESVDNLIDGLETLAHALKIKAKVGVPGAGLEAEFDPGRVRQGLLGDSDPYEQIFDALRKISDKSVPGNITIMVLIDDLDRCFPENAVRLLESIKLVLSQPGFVFILGASRAVIEDYLNSKYEKEFGIKDFNGSSYLDKMIQLAFDIPPHISRIDNFTNDIIGGIKSKNTRNELKPLVEVIGITCQHNPRSIIRFVNRLITDSAIYKLKNTNVSRAVLPMSMFAVTRSLQQTWVDTYGLLIGDDKEEDRQYCSIVASWSDADLREWVKYASPSKIKAGSSELDRSILKFPKVEAEVLKQIASYVAKDKTLKKLLRQPIGREWLLNHELREASISFLITEHTPLDGLRVTDTSLLYSTDSRPDLAPYDDMYNDAINLVVQLGKASTSLLQRRLRIGYARAARIIEQMESEGIIAPADGARPRKVLIEKFH